jgi:hypothetical protein
LKSPPKKKPITICGIQINTGDLNKALKDLVNVITDQELVQSDLNDEDDDEIE